MISQILHDFTNVHDFTIKSDTYSIPEFLVVGSKSVPVVEKQEGCDEEKCAGSGHSDADLKSGKIVLKASKWRRVARDEK
jgi:hypothetical protein